MVAQLRPRLGVQELKELEAFELEYDTSTRNERIILFTPLTEMGASTIFSASLIAAAFSLLAYLQFYEGTPIAPFAFFVAFWLWWPSILRVGHLMSMPLRRMFAGTTARGTFWSVMSFRMMLQLILLLFSVGSGVLLSLVLVPAATLSMAYKSYRFLKTLRDACASL